MLWIGPTVAIGVFQGDIFHCKHQTPRREIQIPVYFLRKSVFPGGKNPCACFQAERVRREGARRFFLRGEAPIVTVDISGEDFDSAEESSEDAQGSEGWLDVMCFSWGTGQGKHGEDMVEG